MPTKQLLNYLLENVQILKSVTLISFFAGVPGTVLNNLHLWVSLNIDYLSVVGIAIAVDHLFGTWVHYFIKKDGNIVQNIMGLGLKLAVVLLMGGLFEGLSSLTKEQDLIFQYLKMVTRILVLLYPMRSAMLNCYIITKGKFPPKALIEKSSKFQKTLDVKDLGINEEQQS